MKPEERDALEKRLAQAAAWRDLDFEDLAEWKGCAFTSKYRCHSGKTFLVWKAQSDEPKVLDIYKVTNFGASLIHGFVTTLTDEFGEEHVVTHTPARLASHKVFMHIPYMQEMQYLPNANNSAKVLRFPLVVRQQGRPASLAAGGSYLTDVVDFVRLFPQFTDRKF